MKSIYVILLIIFFNAIIYTDEGIKKKLNNRDKFLIKRFIKEMGLKGETLNKDEIKQIYNKYYFLIYGKTSQSRKALTYFEKNQAMSIIGEALLRGNKNMRIRYIESLLKLNKIEAIPFFIKALKQSNYIEEGSESATMHEYFKKKLLIAISNLSNKDFKIKDVNNKTEVNKIIKKIEEWWNNRKIK